MHQEEIAQEAVTTQINNLRLKCKDRLEQNGVPVCVAGIASEVSLVEVPLIIRGGISINN